MRTLISKFIEIVLTFRARLVSGLRFTKQTSGAKVFSSHAGAPTDRLLFDDEEDLYKIQMNQVPNIPPVQTVCNAVKILTSMSLPRLLKIIFGWKLILSLTAGAGPFFGVPHRPQLLLQRLSTQTTPSSSCASHWMSKATSLYRVSFVSLALSSFLPIGAFTGCSGNLRPFLHSSTWFH